MALHITCASFFAHNKNSRITLCRYNSAYRGHFMPGFYIINMCYSKQSSFPSFTHPNLKTNQKDSIIIISFLVQFLYVQWSSSSSLNVYTLLAPTWSKLSKFVLVQSLLCDLSSNKVGRIFSKCCFLCNSSQYFSNYQSNILKILKKWLTSKTAVKMSYSGQGK